MRILLTGATGFNGKNLISPLLKTRHNVRCLVRNNSLQKDLDYIKQFNPEIAWGDLLDKDSLEKATKNVDVIIHLGGLVDNFKAKKKDYMNVNFFGTKNLLSAANKNNVKKIIFYSTISVYSKSDNADESTNPSSRGYYELSKIKAEKLIKKSGLEHTIFRMGLIFGSFNKRMQKLVLLLKKKRFVLIGKGKNLIQPIYIDDAVKIIIKELEYEKGNGVVNVAGEKRITTLNFYNKISKALFNENFKPFLKIPYFLALISSFILRNTLPFLGIDPIITKSALDFQTENRTYSINKLNKIYKIKFSDLDSSIDKFVDWSIIK